ncbi:PiggyBac transposable element-derived protein 2 [Trichinella papuae]|uniref:PiggyBac transposable element-derived protein 2 n=1 Tax=Trichinella papuae TaxID=268474 RepID=A0A0V1MPW6_9BILA|nr:PiggyBac transposable element-derived protein 2 [Trichinella papuae]
MLWMRRARRQKPPAVLAGGVFELGGGEVLLPRHRVYLSQTCNEQRRRIARAVTVAKLAVVEFSVCFCCHTTKCCLLCVLCLLSHNDGLSNDDLKQLAEFSSDDKSVIKAGNNATLLMAVLSEDQEKQDNFRALLDYRAETDVTLKRPFVDGKEEFIGFLEMIDLSGAGIARMILQKLHELGIDCSYLVGQGYDGAAVMSDISEPQTDSDDDQRSSSEVESSAELTSEDEETETFRKAEFRHFFHPALLKHIVEQSHVYAAQCNSNFQIAESELVTFLRTLLKMGLVPMPRYSMYWSAELRCDAIADAMSGNRFRDVMRYLHFNDNSEAVLDRESPRYDRLFKVRPLIESIRQSCLRLEQEEYQSIDEEIIPYKGKNKIKHYNPKKPKKWGIKVNAMTGVSGLLYDFCIYEGKVPKVKKPSGCLSFDVVMKLCETVPRHRNFKIFFDNYFTHFDLQLRLLKKGIHTIGTIRRNRLKNAPLKSEKDLKEAGRGAFHVCTTAENNLCVVRWHDSAVVDLSSTYVCTQPVSKVKRWNKKEKALVDVSCPAIVKEYNKYMGGVDLAGMLRALYRIDHRSRKWYRRIFFWTIHVAVVNGWLKYKRDLRTSEAASSSQKDLMQFALDVAEALTKVNKAYPRKSRGRMSLTANVETSRRRVRRPEPATAARLDQVAHWPEVIQKKNRCRGCQKTSECDASNATSISV